MRRDYSAYRYVALRIRALRWLYANRHHFECRMRSCVSRGNQRRLVAAILGEHGWGAAGSRGPSHGGSRAAAGEGQGQVETRNQLEIGGELVEGL